MSLNIFHIPNHVVLPEDKIQEQVTNVPQLELTVDADIKVLIEKIRTVCKVFMFGYSVLNERIKISVIRTLMFRSDVFGVTRDEPVVYLLPSGTLCERLLGARDGRHCYGSIRM